MELAPPNMYILFPTSVAEWPMSEPLFKKYATNGAWLDHTLLSGEDKSHTKKIYQTTSNK